MTRPRFDPIASFETGMALLESEIEYQKQMRADSGATRALLWCQEQLKRLSETQGGG